MKFLEYLHKSSDESSIVKDFQPSESDVAENQGFAHLENFRKWM